MHRLMRASSSKKPSQRIRSARCHPVFLFLFGLNLVAGSPGDFPVTLKLDDAPLGFAAQKVADLADFNLVYSERLVSGILVQCDFKELAADEALTLLLKHTPVTHRWSSEKRVVLRPRERKTLATVSGFVGRKFDGEALAGVRIEALGSGRLAISDESGRFDLPGLSRELTTLRVSAPNFLACDVVLSSGRGTDKLRVLLILAPHVKEHLVIAGNKVTPLSVDPSGGGLTLSPDEVTARYGGLGRDLFDGLSMMPGVDRGDAGDPGVSIRGSAPAENLVLLDGIKLYQPDHAMGYYSSVNSDALEKVHIFKSGSPARYGGHISGVLDLETRGGELGRRDVRVGLTREIGDATVSFPLGQHASLLLSARASLDEATSRSATERVFERTFNDTRYVPEPDDGVRSSRQLGFDDLVANVTIVPNASQRLSLTLFQGTDKDKDGLDVGVPNDWLRVYQRSGSWGNRGASLNWAYQHGQRAHTEVTFAWSHFDSDFDFYELYFPDPEDQDDEGFEESQELSDQGFATHEDRIRNTLKEKSLRIKQAARVGKAHTVEFGLAISGVETWYREESNDDYEYTGSDNAEHQSFFLQELWQPRENLDITIGFRSLTDDRTETTYHEPRASLDYRHNQRFSMRASWGRFHQLLIRSPDTVNYFWGAKTWFLADDFLQPESARHLQLGGRYVADNLLLDVEIYDKKQQGGLTRLHDPARGALDESSLLQSADQIRGLDLLVQKRLGRVSASLGYGFRKTEVRQNLHTGEALGFPTDRDSPHNLKAVVDFRGERWLFSSFWQYSSGRPYGVPALEAIELQPDEEVTDFDDRYRFITSEEPNALRLPAIHQMDISLRRQFLVRAVAVELGLTLRNIYDRKNTLYRYYFVDEEVEDVDDEDFELIPANVKGFGFRGTLDLRMRF